MSVRFVRNERGIRQLLQSPQLIAEIQSLAAGIAEQAGPGVEVKPLETAPRIRVAVVTATWEARHREATTRALTRAFGPPWKRR